MKKFFALLLAVAMVLSMAACNNTDSTDPTKPNGTNPTEPNGPDIVEADYTFHSYTEALGSCWNPHAWDTNADDSIQSYLQTPLVSMSIKDSEEGLYQWIYLAASSVEDVTKDHQDDLTKYPVLLPAGKTAADITEGFVYEIKLNPNMKWEDGTPINADTYIYSMKALLDPDMRNYRANLYWAGESAVAGGYEYYNSGAPIYNNIVPAYGADEEPDYSYDVQAAIAAGKLYVSLGSYETTAFGDGYSLSKINDLVGGAFDELVKPIAEAENPYGYTLVTAENWPTVEALLTGILVNVFGVPAEDAPMVIKECLFSFDGEYMEEVEYDPTVGCYKVDDYTIRYVNAVRIDPNYFLTSLTSNWIVYEDLYEGGKDTTGELVTTNYCTSKDTTMSYGPYKIESLQKDKQLTFVQNPEWYNYQKTDSGYLYAFTDYDVDGAPVRQYQTTKVVIDVMNADAAKQAFLKGQLDEWNPSADELPAYTTSERLFQVDETYTMSLFFNTDVQALQKMDQSKGNVNSVVLSNTNFRNAMSLAIDRADWVTATSGYKPAYSLLNDLYFYDVYNDPDTRYRDTDEAMQAICNLYGVKYGEGTPYATLKDAYESINGYNLTEAKKLMKTACEELVADGLYKAGDPITIRIGWAKGSMATADQNQLTKLNEYINAAAEGSGFGTIKLEGVDNIPDRYGDVPKGEYAIGFGAWGGAAFYPFRNMQVYCDPDQYDVNELADWDPTTETLTIKGLPLMEDGKETATDITLTWQEWSGALVGSGAYADQSFQFKLQALAAMEEAYLRFFYRIPLAGTAVAFLQGYKCEYYTQEYNIMYGFGGLELMTYNYTDAEWADYVASQNGTLNYE